MCVVADPVQLLKEVAPLFEDEVRLRRFADKKSSNLVAAEKANDKVEAFEADMVGPFDTMITDIATKRKKRKRTQIAAASGVGRAYG